MSPRFRKDVGQFVRYAGGHGFACEGMTGSGHWKLRHPSGAVIIVPATPGGYRWKANLEAQVRRMTNKENDHERNRPR